MPKCEPIRDAKGRFAGCKPGTGGSSVSGGGGNSKKGAGGGGLISQKVSTLQELAKKEGIEIDKLSHKARKSVLAKAIEAKRAGKDLREEGLLKSTKTNLKAKPKQQPLTNHEAIAQLGQDFVNRKTNKIDSSIKEIDGYNAQLRAVLPLISTAKTSSERIAINKKLQAIAKKRDEAETSLEGEFQKLRDNVGKSTSLTRKEAEVLAQKTAITISKKEEAEGIKQQLVDFYYVTGGKGSSTISTIKSESPRAYANTAEKIVDVGIKPNKQTIWHELGHHAETENPKIAQASKDFRGSRATTTETEKLSKIMNQSEYRDNEIAIRGNFISPYVGKIYKDPLGKERNATEVFSMGIEAFSSGKDMAALYRQDKGHFNFILGSILNF